MYRERCRAIQLFFHPEAFFWVVDLQKINQQETEEACVFLDKSTIEKTKQFVFEEDRNRSLVAHAFLRAKIGELNSEKPSDIVFLKNEYGKPYIEGNKLYFNLSHTKKRAFFGIHLSCPIGVDIENRQLSIKTKKQEDVETFLKFWCAEEAYLKATGTGFIAQRPNLKHISSSQNVDLFKKNETEIWVYNELMLDSKLAVCLLNNS